MAEGQQQTRSAGDGVVRSSGAPSPAERNARNARTLVNRADTRRRPERIGQQSTRRRGFSSKDEMRSEQDADTSEAGSQAKILRPKAWGTPLSKGQEEEKPEKKMTGVGFYMILALALIKDAVDIALTGTAILSLLIMPIGMVVGFVVFMYYFYNGVGISTKKLAVWVVGILIEMTPALSAIAGWLPVFTLGIIATRILENNELLKAGVAQLHIDHTTK